MDAERVASLLHEVFGQRDNPLLLGLGLGLGTWFLSAMFLALFSNWLNQDWWTAIASILVVLPYWASRMLNLDDSAAEILLDISEGLIILSLSWISATAYRRLLPHLIDNLIAGFVGAHKEHKESLKTKEKDADKIS